MDNKKKVVIGVAWTYANSDIHFGHISAYISGDVLARFHRLNGDDVCMVSGTDCHGTPTTERAIKEHTTPESIVNRYHEQYVKVFEKLGFSYDCYTKTADPYHHKKSQELILKLYEKGYIYPKTELASYCNSCKKFIYDREAEVICPKCGGVSKGDQCDHCAYVFQAQDLLKCKCRICGNQTEVKENTNLYFALSRFEDDIREHINKCRKFWRKNSINETEKFLNEGLVDRAVTRDLNWGIKVPLDGFDDKRIYVWIEAVWGYVTAVMRYCDEQKEKGVQNPPKWQDFWYDHKDGSNLCYLCHGKDNIVFHTIIFPALLKAFDDKMFLPDVCVATEFMNINGEKISKSKGNGWPMLDMLEKFDADSLRLYAIANGPEKKDANFTFEDYHAFHNGEIVNKYANFINRTLNYKGLDGHFAAGVVDPAIKTVCAETFKTCAENIKILNFRDAVFNIFEFASIANKYYDTKAPWVLFKQEDKTEFNNVMSTCLYVIANLSVLFEPFMPFSSKKLQDYLGIKQTEWKPVDFVGEKTFGKFEPLFCRLTEKDVL